VIHIFFMIQEGAVPWVEVDVEEHPGLTIL